MKQRIFVAITLSPALKRSIQQWQQKHKELNARFIEAKNLHLTIIPPWYADPKNVIRKLKAFRPTIKPFNLVFDTVELGPDPRRPRLMWTKGKPNKELMVLQKELAKFLRVKVERRALVPHITVARALHNENPIPQESIDWTLSVESFALMQSHLSPKGASYTVLANFPLV